jgi:hypothetical protein
MNYDKINAKQPDSSDAPEYADKSMAGKRHLAENLLEVGLHTLSDDHPARWVRFDQARRLAVEAGEVGIAFRAIDALAEEFSVDATEMKLWTLRVLAVQVQPKDNDPLIHSGLQLLPTLLVEKNIVASEQLLDLLQTLMKTKDESSPMQQAQDQIDQGRQILAELEKQRRASPPRWAPDPVR